VEFEAKRALRGVKKFWYSGSSLLKGASLKRRDSGAAEKDARDD
jgi:hypothetical protein